MKKKYWLHCGSYDFPTEDGSQLLEFPGSKEEMESYLLPILGNLDHPARNILRAHVPSIDWSKTYTPFSSKQAGQTFQIVECNEASLSPVPPEFYFGNL